MTVTYLWGKRNHHNDHGNESVEWSLAVGMRISQKKRQYVARAAIVTIALSLFMQYIGVDNEGDEWALAHSMRMSQML